MKKLAIILLSVFVIFLIHSYQVLANQEQARQLIIDAFQGDLIAVKNNIEQGAPLDFELYLHDEERQYKGSWFNALHAAASSGNEDLILFLLEEGFDIDNPTSSEGWTPLMIAIRDGQLEAAKLLIYKGADLNAQSKLGATALTFALTQPVPSEKERKDLVLYLLKRGADPNKEDHFGHSALYYTKAQKRSDLTQILQEYDAR